MKGKIKEFFSKNSLKVLLVIVIVLFFIYIFSDNFRFYLLYKDIDPNFLVGFFTATALILSIIQSLSDRRFSYNINLVNSIEDKGIKVIAKLLKIKQKSELFFKTIKDIKRAIGNSLIYIDSNNTLSNEDIQKDLEITTAYIQTYFPEEAEKWNLLQDKFSILATNCSNVLLNYRENIDVLKEPNFSNIILNKINQIIPESENLYKEIDKLAEEMYIRLVEKMNEYKSKLKDSFYFKL